MITFHHLRHIVTISLVCLGFLFLVFFAVEIAHASSHGGWNTTSTRSGSTVTTTSSSYGSMQGPPHVTTRQVGGNNSSNNNDNDNGPPPRNCQVSSWSGFSECTYTCGGGTQSRSRSITTSPAHGGAACPALSNSRSCNPQACEYDFEARGLNSGDESTATPNGIEGTYDNYDVSVQLRNNGPDFLYSRTPVPYKLALDLDDIWGRKDLGSPDDSHRSNLSTSTNSSALNYSFNDVPFGSHEICGRVNPDRNRVLENQDTEFLNNEICFDPVDIAVPDPETIKITASSQLIRSGGEMLIEWTAHTAYPMDCTIFGPGFTTEHTFDASDSHPSPYRGSDTATNLENAGVFTLSCTEPSTGDTFTDDVFVEVMPTFQEI
jgi:hypothetical protein